MNTPRLTTPALWALICAACLCASATHAQLTSTPPSSGGVSGGISIGDLLGTPPASGGGTSGSGTSNSGVAVGGAGAMCSAPLGGATCGGAGPASQGNTSGVNTGAGNPINLTNGNKFQTDVDLPALPGELGLEIVRHYNSTHRYVLGQLGVGWRLSYETDLFVIGRTVQILQADGARLVFNIDPRNPSHCAGADPTQGWVQILTRDSGKKEYLWHWTHGEHAGRQLRFDHRGKLVQIIAASGAVLSIEHGPKGELLKVTDPQGRTLSFNHGGLARVRQAEEAQRQQRQQQRQQERHASRNGSSSEGNGKGAGTQDLVASASGLAVFTGIQSIDSPVGRFTYEQGVPAPKGVPGNTPEALALARAQAVNLVLVGLPTHVDSTHSAHAFANRPASSSSLRRQYHYEDARHPQALTGISVLGSGSDGQVIQQRLATYQYNERAQAILSVRGEADSTTERVQVQILKPSLQSYRPNVANKGNGNPTGQTLLTNSLGQQTLYTHQIIDGQYRLLQAVGAGCTLCGPVNLRWGYDARGRLIELTHLSPVAVVGGQPQGTPQPLLTTRHTLDAQGRTERIEQIAFVNGKAQEPRLIERHEYTDTRWLTKPTLIAKPSVVAGQEHRIALTYNEAGQLTQLTQSGWSPVDANGQPANTPAQASRIERTTHYTHTRINGRSLLTQVDGPLPNGPSNSPQDSDITRLEWDERGRFLKTVHTPGGLRSDITHHAATGLVERVVNDAGFATTFTYNTQLQPTRISSRGPDWAQPLVQSFQYDALGHLVQSFEGDATAENKGADAMRARPTERQGFDAQGRLLWHASALGLLQTWQYNTEGRLLQSARRSSTMEQVTTQTYDDLGRPTGMSDNAGRARGLRYGADGLPMAYVDALGREHASQTPVGRTKRASSGPRAAPQPLPLIDDFGRQVLTLSPDSGRTLRGFDEADRLVSMTDAQGHHAAYTYDAQGRILSQRITDARTQAVTPTEWRYNARHLLEVIHPTQLERFEVDARGLRKARIVTVVTPHGELTSVTRYDHDEKGQLVASTLPDGSRLAFERNGQQQVVALKRQTIQTPWLRWLGREQTLAQDFERDLVGLRSFTTGNGIQALYQRSTQGDLTRVVYRHVQPRAALQARSTKDNTLPLLGRTTQETIEQLLGIQAAHAQTAVPSPSAGPAAAPSEPGALGLPTDPQALIDHRYLWSPEGHLLHSQQRGGSASEHTQHSHAFDAQGRLVASVQASLNEGAGQEKIQEQSVWRYAYDAQQRRVLSQQGASSQSDLSTGTQRSQFHEGSHRLHLNAAPTTYNANGQPERVGQREYVWDALGRLLEVRQEAQPIAQYRYDHRGLRIGKTVMPLRTEPTSVWAEPVEALTTLTLHDESRQPLADLDAQGRITRQYVWLADMPLAVIDTPASLALTEPGIEQVVKDIATALQSWFDDFEGIAWLHTNHLGAPEAATNAQGDVVWSASYSPFGAAKVLLPLPVGERAGVRGAPAPAFTPRFTLNLRLPGQLFDEETGLHHNRQRYYDPELGQYLTPDPLGTPDGPNPYAYVAFNPLGFIDPDGLVLFAFDGTGNDESNPNELTNVVRFRNLYASDEGLAFYITGPGTRDPRSGIEHPWYLGGNPADTGASFTGRQRIASLINDLRRQADATPNEAVIDIDVVGFSRGAAQARDFANQVASATRNNWYEYTDTAGTTQCQRVNLRFMGLFDTVLSTHRGAYNLGIPEAFGHVAHAVAMNEYRNLFPLESIAEGQFSDKPVPGQVRIERGFLGAHSDIGGSFADGDLAKVALTWMVEQATAAGVQMDALTSEQTTITADPVIHDKSSNLFASTGPAPTSFSEDRVIRFRDGSAPRQRSALVGSGTGYLDTVKSSPTAQTHAATRPVRWTCTATFSGSTRTATAST